MEKLTIFLGATTAIFHGIAFVMYNLQTKAGNSKPNAVSWAMWAFLATLNALSYREMSGDLISSLQFFTGSVACVLTFLYVLFIGKFDRLNVLEWLMLALGFVAILVWWKFQSATGANLIILLAIIFSFIPTFKGVIADPFKEAPNSWILWTIAFLITIINIILRDGKVINLVTPLIMFIGHGAIALLSSEKRKCQFKKLL